MPSSLSYRYEQTIAGPSMPSLSVPPTPTMCGPTIGMSNGSHTCTNIGESNGSHTSYTDPTMSMRGPVIGPLAAARPPSSFMVDEPIISGPPMV